MHDGRVTHNEARTAEWKTTGYNNGAGQRGREIAYQTDGRSRFSSPKTPVIMISLAKINGSSSAALVPGEGTRWGRGAMTMSLSAPAWVEPR